MKVISIVLKGTLIRKIEADSRNHAVKLLKSEAGHWVHERVNQFGMGSSSSHEFAAYHPPDVLHAKDKDFAFLPDEELEED